MHPERAVIKRSLERYGRGFTLVELMVGIVVGLILLAAVIGVFVASVRANSATLTMAQLNHEVRIVAEIVANDLRRSGFDNTAGTRTLEDIANPYVEIQLSAAGDCVLFGYDRDVTAGDFFGFRLAQNNDGVGFIEMKPAADTADCGQSWAGNSAPLTDPRRVDIVGFELTTAGSLCFNLALRGPATDPPLDDDAWLWGAQTFEFPCERDDLGADDATPLAVENTEDGDLLVEHRRLSLTVVGEARGRIGQAGVVDGQAQPFRTVIGTQVFLPNHRRILAQVP